MFKSFFERLHLKRIWCEPLKAGQVGSLIEFLLIIGNTWMTHHGWSIHMILLSL